VKQIKIKCPKCGFDRSVPTKELPDKPRIKAVCPKCEERFSVELQSSKNSSKPRVSSSFSKKTTLAAMAFLLIAVALTAFYLGRKTNTEEIVHVTPKSPVAIKTAPEVKPTETKEPAIQQEPAKEEGSSKGPQPVTLQCSGEARMVDYSPSAPGSSGDTREAGPWPFTGILKLALDGGFTGIELFLEHRDEFVALDCKETQESCSAHHEITETDIQHNLRLKQGENLFTRELTINRANGNFHHTSTILGDQLHNKITQTGECRLIETGVASF
jgi:hypothetical protein